MPQRSIRFPDDLAAAIEGEAVRLERSFSWVAINAMRAGLVGLAEAERRVGLPVALDPSQPRGTASLVGRGSPSPSLERFVRAKGGKR